VPALLIDNRPGRPDHPRDVGVSLDALREARVPLLDAVGGELPAPPGAPAALR
jgi:hypothetical protein